MLDVRIKPITTRPEVKGANYSVTEFVNLISWFIDFNAGGGI